MRERVYYNFSDDKEKQAIMVAFKNENKFTKKLPLLNSNNEEIGKIIKVDEYSTYLDFWLDEYIQDSVMSNKKGQITAINLYEKENSKGVKQKRIRSIVA